MAASNSTPTVALTTVAAPSLLGRAKTQIEHFFLPECLRREYRNLLAYSSKNKHAHIALGATVLFAAAEYEQPGYFPRPRELTAGLVGFLGAFALIFPAYALMEYADSHIWPWNGEGWVWPWEAILWSSTVYNDETPGDSVAIYKYTNITASPTIGSTTPAVSPARPDIIIPPMPLLPRGLRPVHLPPLLTHHSGILGESPMPIKFKHFSGNLDLGSVHEE